MVILNGGLKNKGPKLFSNLGIYHSCVAFLLLSILLHTPTEVEGGKCTECCLKYKGDKVVKSECTVHPGQPIYPFRMCFLYLYM
ncbi:hypothetical protein Bca4012_023387 [Brassica carinata]